MRFEKQQVTIFVPNHVGGDGRWLSFPDPLLASGITSDHDYLPLALESLPLAFIEVSIAARMTPMEPYRRLRELGTSTQRRLEFYEAPNSELANWMKTRLSRKVLRSRTPRTPVRDPMDGISARRSLFSGRRSCTSRTPSCSRLRNGVRTRCSTCLRLRDDIDAALSDLMRSLHEDYESPTETGESSY